MLFRSLETRRYGDDGPEFECSDIRRMSRYINNMAHELEQDIQPAFIAEKEAVSLYAGICGEPRGLYIYREGDHRYSYTSFLDGRQRMVIAAVSLEDAPPGFVPEQARSVRGIYVYCPEDAGIPMPGLAPQSADKPQKRKEHQR